MLAVSRSLAGGWVYAVAEPDVLLGPSALGPLKFRP